MRARSRSGVVVVVEDEWLVRDDIVHELKAGGWEVLEASTAEGAIGLLHENRRIDILVTDIQLAGYLSGWDVAEAFRAAQPKMPVIYASGNTVDQSRAVIDSLFFRKPYRAAEILNACRRLAGETQDKKEKPRPKPGR
ncbi:MAG: response regulator [Hyphomonadaceae bacterium]|jgi:CheY-like chemotaxis protein|nr:response regulator [Hyphomonadaceae bacterium]